MQLATSEGFDHRDTRDFTSPFEAYDLRTHELSISPLVGTLLSSTNQIIFSLLSCFPSLFLFFFLFKKNPKIFNQTTLPLAFPTDEASFPLLWSSSLP